MAGSGDLSRNDIDSQYCLLYCLSGCQTWISESGYLNGPGHGTEEDGEGSALRAFCTRCLVLVCGSCCFCMDLLRFGKHLEFCLAFATSHFVYFINASCHHVRFTVRLLFVRGLGHSGCPCNIFQPTSLQAPALSPLTTISLIDRRFSFPD